MLAESGNAEVGANGSSPKRHGRKLATIIGTAEGATASMLTPNVKKRGRSAKNGANSNGHSANGNGHLLLEGMMLVGELQGV